MFTPRRISLIFCSLSLARGHIFESEAAGRKNWDSPQVAASLLCCSCLHFLCDWLLSPASVTNLIRKSADLSFSQKKFSCSSAPFSDGPLPSNRVWTFQLLHRSTRSSSITFKTKASGGFGGSRCCALVKVRCVIFGLIYGFYIGESLIYGVQNINKKSIGHLAPPHFFTTMQLPDRTFRY